MPVDDSAPRPGYWRQYCLVLFHPPPEGARDVCRLPARATAFITRCLDQEDADLELSRTRRLMAQLVHSGVRGGRLNYRRRRAERLHEVGGVYRPTV